MTQLWNKPKLYGKKQHMSARFNTLSVVGIFINMSSIACTVTSIIAWLGLLLPQGAVGAEPRRTRSFRRQKMVPEEPVAPRIIIRYTLN